jgi:hypothetical protein
LKTLRYAFVLNVFWAATVYAAGSPIAGTWTGKMHDLPAVKMTVNNSGGKLTGNIVFYFLMLENGAWKVKGEANVQMIDPHLEGHTFVFTVPHAKKHGSTDPKDQEIKTFRVQLTGPNEAVFKNADNGEDLKLTRSN